MFYELLSHKLFLTHIDFDLLIGSGMHYGDKFCVLTENEEHRAGGQV